MTARRPIFVGLLVATLVTVGFILFVRWSQSIAPDASGLPASTLRASVGNAAPAIVGTTLDGAPFDLASAAGKPIVINFWGPSCVPCRDEFPVLAAKAVQHAADGLTVVGVLTDDPVEPAREFAAQNGGTWPTVIDPAKVIKDAYRSPGGHRPTSWTGPASSARSRSVS